MKSLSKQEKDKDKDKNSTAHFLSPNFRKGVVKEKKDKEKDEKESDFKLNLINVENENEEGIKKSKEK